MNTYLKISNAGEIEPNAFKLIGASTKRDDNSKIGFFGSGLKYSMAYMLRENINLKIFSGMQEVVLSTRPETYREKEFKIITINGEDTSMTTDMGPDWKVWYIVRELYCNAIDEGTPIVEVVTEDDVLPHAGSTNFYIQVDGRISDVVQNWDHYFSDKRKDILFNSLGRKLYKSHGSLIVYRKGIQCYTINDKSLFHYDFENLGINESRVLDSPYVFRGLVSIFFGGCPEVNIITELINALDRGEQVFERHLRWDDVYNINADVWLAAINNRTIVIDEIAGWYKEDVERNRDKMLLLPAKVVDMLERLLTGKIKVMGENYDGYVFKKIEKNQKHTFLIDEVNKFFSECDYAVSCPIEVMSVEQTYIHSLTKNNTIFINEHVFNMGRRKIAEVIMVENEYAKTGYKKNPGSADEFRDHLVSQLISKMEEKQAFFL